MKNERTRQHVLSSRLALILIVLITAALAAGCGSGGGQMRAKFSREMIAETAAAAMETGAAPGAVNSYDEGAAADTAATTGSALTSPNSLTPTMTGRKLIRTVNLNVETTEFDALLESLTQSITTLGGYIEQSNISGNSISASQGSRRYASMTARVPSDKLDGFIARINSESNITNKSENTEDVTLQYADIEGRKKTLEVEQERLWELLASAESMDAVIALESRLSEIRYQLESFGSQLRNYDNRVDYSTVYLNIDEVKVFTPTTPDSVMTRIQKGFSRSLADVGNTFLNFFIWFVSSLPAIVALATIGAVLFLLVRKITGYSKGHPRKSGKPGKSKKEAPTEPLVGLQQQTGDSDDEQQNQTQQ